MEGLRLRPAVEQDVPAILGFIRELGEFERLANEMVASEADLRAGLFGARPAAEAWMAEVEDRPVGYMLFWTTYSTFLGKPGIYLEDLYVQEAWRGRGIGTALLRQCARVAVERGCGRLEWAALRWNEAALALYRKLGAGPLDEWLTLRVSGAGLARLAHGER